MLFSSPYWLPTFCDHLSIPASVSFSFVLYSASVLRYVRRHLTFVLSRLLFWISCAFCFYYYVMFPLCVMVCGAASDSILFDFGFVLRWCFEIFFFTSIVVDWGGSLLSITSFVSYFNSIFNSIHLFMFTCSIGLIINRGHIEPRDFRILPSAKLSE